jgi:hypothetical protein
MKQKYLLLKNDEKTKLIIREFAELDKDKFALLCEETFDNESVESAIAKGKETLIATLRTQNFFPIGIFAEKIAEGVINLWESENGQSVELFFNDIDLLTKKEKEPLISYDIEDEPAEIDDLLEEDELNPIDIEKDEISKIAQKTKVSEDEPGNTKDKG